MRRMHRSGLLFVVMACLLNACASTPTVSPGIQSGYAGISLARTLFLPVFVLAAPGTKASVDVSAISVDGVDQIIESTVLSSFRNQKGVKGYHPAGVMKALAGNEQLLQKALDYMRDRARKRASEAKELSKDCRGSRSFLDFYTFCVSPETDWRDALNALAIRVGHADSALFVIVTDLEKVMKDKRFVIGAEITSLLVDTNNGRLIWGRQASDTLESDQMEAKYPEWSSLFSRILSEPYWNGFPGRVSTEG